MKPSKRNESNARSKQEKRNTGPPKVSKYAAKRQMPVMGEPAKVEGSKHE